MEEKTGFDFLKVFLCHASEDKPAVQALYTQLTEDGIGAAWLDEEKLLPGQNWDREIREAIRSSHVILVCLSSGSIEKAGYVQDEITLALAAADEQAERITIIPVKIEECDIPPQLQSRQWVSIFQGQGILSEQKGYKKLMEVMRSHAGKLGAPLFFKEDKKLFAEFFNLFDRPAFRGPFIWQSDPSPAARVMTLTFKAITTGGVEDSQGREWKRIQPVSEIKDNVLRSEMHIVLNKLKTARNLVDILVHLRDKATTTTSEQQKYLEIRAAKLDKIDKERDSMIVTMNRILDRFGLDQLPIPTTAKDSTDVYEQFPSH